MRDGRRGVKRRAAPARCRRAFRLTDPEGYAYAFTSFRNPFEYLAILKSTARQSQVGGEAAPPGNEAAGIDLARRRLDDALARLETEVVARVAQARSEAGDEFRARVAALETEVAKLKSEKRKLERVGAELRRAAEAAGTRVDRAAAHLHGLLNQGGAEEVGNA